MILGLISMQVSCTNCEKEINSQRNTFITAFVDSIYESKQNRYTPTIRIRDSVTKRYIELDGYSFPILLGESEKGDRLIKDSNSLLYRLIKNNGNVKAFYPYCDGKQLK